MSGISQKLKDMYLEVAENIDFVNPFLENSEALENGTAEYVDTLGKHIYLYGLRSAVGKNYYT